MNSVVSAVAMTTTAPGTSYFFIVSSTNLSNVAYFALLFPEQPASIFRLNTGTGIGGGFIKDGNLFVGDSYRGMEIGHLMIQPDGPLCQCGNRGCLEAIAGESGIRRRVEELIANGVSTELKNGPFSIGRFCELAKSDKAARMLAHDISAKISSALCTVVALLNPAAIIAAEYGLI